MKSIEFCYWLQGCFDFNDIVFINAKQTTTIKEKLNSVFENETLPFNFCYELKETFDIANVTEFNETQTKQLKNMLQQTFVDYERSLKTNTLHYDSIMQSDVSEKNNIQLFIKTEFLSLEEIHQRLYQNNLKRGQDIVLNTKVAIAKC